MNIFWKFIRKVYFKILWEIDVTDDMDRTVRKLRDKGFDIGDNVFLDHVSIEENYPEFLKIEDNVTIAYGTRILLHDSALNNLYGDPVRFGKVLIKEGAYIGSECLIMPGVSVGKNALVGARSLVTKNVEDNTVVIGSPAKFYMSIDEYRKKFLKDISKDNYYYWNIEPFMKRLKRKNWQEEEKSSYLRFLKENSIKSEKSK